MIHTRLRQGHQINTDAPELRRRHANSSRILRIGNTQVLLIDIHELQVILAQPIVLAALKNQVEDIRSIFSLDGQDVFVLGSAQDFGKGGEVETESDVAIAAVGGERLGLEHHGDQGDVGVVHGLEGNAGVIAIEVAILDQVLDRIDDLES